MVVVKDDKVAAHLEKFVTLFPINNFNKAQISNNGKHFEITNDIIMNVKAK